MNQKALNALEYPKIIEKLTEKASSYMGKQLCKNLEPSTDLETIRLSIVFTGLAGIGRERGMRVL